MSAAHLALKLWRNACVAWLEEAGTVAQTRLRVRTVFSILLLKCAYVESRMNSNYTVPPITIYSICSQSILDILKEAILVMRPTERRRCLAPRREEIRGGRQRGRRGLRYRDRRSSRRRDARSRMTPAPRAANGEGTHTFSQVVHSQIGILDFSR